MLATTCDRAVTEIAGDRIAEGRRTIDAELRAQVTAVRLETIDQCQPILSKLQDAIGDTQTKQRLVIDAEVERLRRPN